MLGSTLLVKELFIFVAIVVRDVNKIVINKVDNIYGSLIILN